MCEPELMHAEEETREVYGELGDALDQRDAALEECSRLRELLSYAYDAPLFLKVSSLSEHQKFRCWRSETGRTLTLEAHQWREQAMARMIEGDRKAAGLPIPERMNIAAQERDVVKAELQKALLRLAEINPNYHEMACKKLPPLGNPLHHTPSAYYTIENYDNLWNAYTALCTALRPPPPSTPEAKYSTEHAGSAEMYADEEFIGNTIRRDLDMRARFPDAVENGPCANCGNEVSWSPKSQCWVHEDADQRSCERAELGRNAASQAENDCQEIEVYRCVCGEVYTKLDHTVCPKCHRWPGYPPPRPKIEGYIPPPAPTGTRPVSKASQAEARPELDMDALRRIAEKHCNSGDHTVDFDGYSVTVSCTLPRGHEGKHVSSSLPNHPWAAPAPQLPEESRTSKEDMLTVHIQVMDSGNGVVWQGSFTQLAELFRAPEHIGVDGLIGIKTALDYELRSK